MANFRQETISVAGCRVSVFRGGTGAPLLHLHGAGVVRSVMPFMEFLAENFDVIIPQHPGFGDSDEPDWLEGMGDLAYFYLEFMEQLDLRGVHLGGTSLGGWLAMEIAMRSTERLDTLTLIGAGGIHVEGVERGKSREWGPHETMRQVIYDQSLAEKMIATMPEHPEQDPVYQKNRRTIGKLAKPPTYNPDIQKWAHLVKIPVHIIWGDHDRLLPMAFAPEYAKLFDDATLDIMKECGHIPYTEKPREYADLINRFIQEATQTESVTAG